MRKAPILVKAVGWLFILSGAVGIVYHASEIDPNNFFEPELFWTLALRLIAIASGALLLRGVGWARWAAVGWLAYHVVVGAMHGITGFVLHCALLIGVAYALYRPPSRPYFNAAK